MSNPEMGIIPTTTLKESKREADQTPAATSREVTCSAVTAHEMQVKSKIDIVSLD